MHSIALKRLTETCSRNGNSAVARTKRIISTGFKEEFIIKKKTLTIIIALACAVVFVLGCTGTSGKNPSTAAPTEQAQLPTEAPDYSDLDVWKSANVWSKAYGSLYEYCMARADDEQKQKLKNIELSFQGIGSERNYTKQILQIIGDLPEDVPMLTLEQVHEVFANLPEYRSSENGYQNVTKKLNAITGAPDYEGGSGIGFKIYFLNSEHTQYLIVWDDYYAAVRSVAEGEPGYTIDEELFGGSGGKSQN